MNVSLSLQKPPGRISGRVVTGEDRQPVANASIRLVVDDVIVDAKMTNRSGGFNSRLLYSGHYRVEADYEDLSGAADGVEVRLGETTEITIELV